MRHEVVLPELGENILHAAVLRVMVAQGEKIALEQPLLELETDKATTELPSPVAGTVAEVKVQAGDDVRVGQVLVVLHVEAGQSSVESVHPAPTVGSLEVSTPSSQAGPATLAGAAVAVSSTHSDVPPAEIPAAPAVRRLSRELGVALEQVTGTGPRGRISIEDVKRHAREHLRPSLSDRGDVRGQESMDWGAQAEAETGTSGAERETGVSARAAVTGASRSLASPAVLPAVPALAALEGTQPAGHSAPTEASVLPDFSLFGPIERVPMTGVRYATALHVARAWSQVPQVTQHDKADITELEALKKRYRPQAETQGVRLTPTVFVLKAVASALKVFPTFNSSLDMARRELILKRSIHIGVAVDAGYGLVVPVVRDVDRLSWLGIAKRLSEVSEGARARKLPPDAYRGGGFTVTNLGSLGTTTFTPLVSWPEVAILGVGRAAMEPFYTQEGFVPRLFMPLSLSYDHRAIDGAEAARFLRWVAEALEQPLKLLLEG